MTDIVDAAEAMFRAMAERRGLTIEKQEPTEFELCMTIPGDDVSGALPVRLTLQNKDELNFDVGDFGSYLFPFEEVKGLFDKAVEGWFTGQTRLAYYWRGKRLVKIYLQVKLKNGKWQRIFSEYRTALLPFVTTRIEYKMGTRLQPKH